MTRSVTAVVLLVVYVFPDFAAADTGSRRVRGLDAWANESLERGIRRSALVRGLIAILDASDLIVHVESSDILPAGLAGMTRFVAFSHGSRYVRITLDRRLDADMRSATLAHELQHASELAQSRAESPREIQRLYESIGHRVAGKEPFYETMAARHAGARAWKELRGYSTNPQAGSQ